jgi:hypothetical protein
MMDTPFGNARDTVRGTYLTTGLVRAAEGQRFLVESDGCLRGAVRATGCLVEPSAGDTALVCVDGNVWYILSILRREADGPLPLSFEKGVSLAVGGGSFAVEASSVCLGATEKLALAGRVLSIDAEKGSARVGRFSWAGETFSAGLERARIAVKFLDTVSERLVQRMKRCYRTVEDFEENTVGRLRVMIKGRLFVKSKNTAVVADETVKVNGDKILLG